MSSTLAPNASASTTLASVAPSGNITADETAAVTTAPPRRRLGKLILNAGLVFCCSSAGLAASMTLRSANESSEPDPTPPPISSGSEESEHHEITPAMEGLRIDILMKSGNFKAALSLCREVPRTTFGSDERLLIYREALCLEGLGHWSDAKEAYIKASRSNPDLPISLWARGMLGQARCALAEGDIATCQDLLDRVLLRSGDPLCREQRILAECMFLLGRAEVQKLPPHPSLDPFDITAIAWPTLDGGLDRYLEWLPLEQPETAHPVAKEHTAPHDAGHREAKDHPAPNAGHHEGKDHPTPDTGHHEAKDQHGPGATPHEEKAAEAAPTSGWLAPLFRQGYVRLKRPEQPITEQLRAVGAAVGLEVKIGLKAEEKLATIPVAIDVDNVPLPSILTALTRKHGFGWQIANETISIGPAAHLDDSAQQALALETLRQGLAFAPEHPRERAARITAANLDLGAGRRRNAAVQFRQMLENEPHAAETVYVTYNLGLIELTNGNWPVAQARFLDTIDRGPETKWADFGSWWIGRVQLDKGDTAAARKPLETARDGKTKLISAAAELGLAACALLDGEENEVREIIKSHRVYNGESHAALAGFFDTWLRYKSNPSESRAKRVAEALVSIGEGRLLGPIGYLLAGQTYREIGHFDRVAGLYDAATQFVRGPLAIRMMFEAAERYDQLDFREEARKRYSVVAVIDREEWGLKAELRLADLAVRDRRGQECVSRCRALIGRKGIDTSEVLALMGRGYEFLKQYRLAADCFAGRVPAE